MQIDQKNLLNFLTMQYFKIVIAWKHLSFLQQNLFPSTPLHICCSGDRHWHRANVVNSFVFLCLPTCIDINSSGSKYFSLNTGIDSGKHFTVIGLSRLPSLSGSYFAYAKWLPGWVKIVSIDAS